MAPAYERRGPSRQRQLVLGLRAQSRRVQRRLRPVGDAELREDVPHVRLDRLLRDPELERDALVRETPADQVEHLLLPWRQVRLLAAAILDQRVDEARGGGRI